MRDHQKNILRVKELVDELPLRERVQLYRWLASVADSPFITKQLLSLADQLENVEEQSRTFDFNFAGPDGRKDFKKDGK